MEKLIKGIVEFRRNVQQGYREAFGRLATLHAPDTLFIACSDSRVVPNTFASTNPGDLFVVRNIGNLVPPCCEGEVGEGSESAAIEFAVKTLGVKDIIVCGHSECAAMRALVQGRESFPIPHVKHWLRHGDEAVKRSRRGVKLDGKIGIHNQVSQLNVLLQIEHIKSYPAVRSRIEAGTLAVHGWWFDIAKADVYAFEPEMNRFVLIDEREAERLVQRLDSKPLDSSLPAVEIAAAGASAVSPAPSKKLPSQTDGAPKKSPRLPPRPTL